MWLHLVRLFVLYLMECLCVCLREMCNIVDNSDLSEARNGLDAAAFEVTHPLGRTE